MCPSLLSLVQEDSLASYAVDPQGLICAVSPLASVQTPNAVGKTVYLALPQFFDSDYIFHIHEKEYHWQLSGSNGTVLDISRFDDGLLLRVFPVTGGNVIHLRSEEARAAMPQMLADIRLFVEEAALANLELENIYDDLDVIDMNIYNRTVDILSHYYDDFRWILLFTNRLEMLDQNALRQYPTRRLDLNQLLHNIIVGIQRYSDQPVLTIEEMLPAGSFPIRVNDRLFEQLILEIIRFSGVLALRKIFSCTLSIALFSDPKTRHCTVRFSNRQNNIFSYVNDTELRRGISNLHRYTENLMELYGGTSCSSRSLTGEVQLELNLPMDFSSEYCFTVQSPDTYHNFYDIFMSKFRIYLQDLSKV